MSLNKSSAHQAILMYILSQGLDGIDGNLARYFDQCSRFGAALDMVADRTACSFIYLNIAILLDNWFYSYCFIICIFLDFGSHYLQFLSSAMLKSESHKGKNTNENFIVHYYYNNYYFFVSLVVFSEVAAVFGWTLIMIPSLKSYLGFIFIIAMV